MLALWAELNVVLADEFRDGNVPAMMEPLVVAKKAFAALPETVTTYYYRGDSACHESGLINWLRDESRAEGPKGFIGFAISARMSEALHKAIEKVPEEAWVPYGKSHPAEICTSRGRSTPAMEPVQTGVRASRRSLLSVGIRMARNYQMDLKKSSRRR
jgi:hypothetical protein